MSDPGRLRRSLARLGRALDPDGDRARAEVVALRRDLRERQARHERDAAEQRAALAQAEAAVARLAADAASSRRDVARVTEVADQQRDELTRLTGRSRAADKADAADRRVRDRLARFARSGLPIIVGPWTGEVGFELLYWIPFLQWARDAFELDPARLVVVSRGGVQPWYAHVTSQYSDVFCHATPDEFRGSTSERKKQRQISPFERQVIRRVMRERGLRRAHLLHPAVMYDAYKAFWRHDASVTRLEALTRFKALPPVGDDLARGLALPADFVAVRFYFSSCFPDTPDNRRFAAHVVAGLAERHHVVLLNNGLVLDDHVDCPPQARDRVHVLTAQMRPETNLAVQTAVISRARAFVGTYGGYSYLAPFYGVDAVACYSAPTFKRHHLELAQRAFERVGDATLVPLDVRRASLLGETFAALASPVAL